VARDGLEVSISMKDLGPLADGRDRDQAVCVTTLEGFPGSTAKPIDACCFFVILKSKEWEYGIGE